MADNNQKERLEVYTKGQNPENLQLFKQVGRRKQHTNSDQSCNYHHKT